MTLLLLTPGDPDEGDNNHPCADAVFLANVDEEHHNGPNLLTDSQGRVTLMTLIPGAKYWTVGDDVRGRFHKEFVVKAEEMLDLGDITVKMRQ